MVLSAVTRRPSSRSLARVIAAIAPRLDISTDGKGCWGANVFVERFWKSIEYEEVYLHSHDSVREARAGIGRSIEFYNTRPRTNPRPID